VAAWRERAHTADCAAHAAATVEQCGVETGSTCVRRMGPELSRGTARLLPGGVFVDNMYIHTHMYMYMYVYIYVCIGIDMYIHIYVVQYIPLRFTGHNGAWRLVRYEV
jgi:hypothetical protein